jgi:hypothetical protein
MTKPSSADAHSTPDLQTTRTLFPPEDAVVPLAALRGKSGSVAGCVQRTGVPAAATAPHQKNIFLMCDFLPQFPSFPTTLERSP